MITALFFPVLLLSSTNTQSAMPSFRVLSGHIPTLNSTSYPLKFTDINSHLSFPSFQLRVYRTVVNSDCDYNDYKVIYPPPRLLLVYVQQFKNKPIRLLKAALFFRSKVMHARLYTLAVFSQ